MRLVLVTAWILLCAAVTAGAYWGFLNTPESTVAALALSALLLLISVALLSFTINGAITLWSNAWSVPVMKRAFARLPSIIPALLVFAVFWWLAFRIDTWIALRSGGINAWFIAQFGWSDVWWFFTAVRFITTFLRWVVGGLLAVSLMGGIAAIGWRAVVRPQWVRRGMRPRALALGTLWFVVLIVLPWMYLVPWRPSWLPHSTAELVFIAAKLSLAAILIATGVALMIREATGIQFPPPGRNLSTLAA